MKYQDIKINSLVKSAVNPHPVFFVLEKNRGWIKLQVQNRGFQDLIFNARSKNLVQFNGISR